MARGLSGGQAKHAAFALNELAVALPGEKTPPMRMFRTI
jgi:hypothetical protein